MAKRLAVFILVVGLISGLPQVALAYSYSGYRWQGLTAYFNDTTQYLPTGFTTCIRSAAGTWNAAGSYFSFSRDGSCSNYWGMADLGTGGTIAIAEVSISGSGYIVECLVAFNTKKPFSTTGASGAYDVESVAVHEFGHWLCLQDVTSPTAAVMYYSLSLGQVRRALHYDDVTGICFIYGPQP